MTPPRAPRAPRPAASRREPARAAALDSAWEPRLRLLGTIALGAVALLVACLSLQQIASVDYWWQWKTGEVVSRSGPPRVDPFSFTHGGQPRVEVRWLYCWGLYQLTNTLGPAAATIVKTLAVFAMFGAMALLAGVRRQRILVAALIAVAAIACSQRLVVRPETATYLFVALFVVGVERLQQGASRWRWMLLALQVVWANVHGLFLLGPAIIGAWGVGEWIDAVRTGRTADPEHRRRLRTAALLVGGTILASCVNPYGPKVLALAIGQGASLGNEIQKQVFLELRSPFSFGQRFTAVVFYEALIGCTVVAALLGGVRQRVFWLLLVASQLYLSTTAIRNLPLFGLVAIPFIGRAVAGSPRAGRFGRAWLVPVRAAVALATIGFSLYQVRQLVTDRFYVQQHAINHFGAGIDTHYFPSGAADFLGATGVTGPVWCTESGGSYLIARGYKVYLDPRGDVYPDAFLMEYSTLAAHPTPALLQAAVQQYGLRVFFVDTLVPDLIEFMAQAPGWRLAYLDSEAGVFLRDDTAPQVPALRLDTEGAAWMQQMRPKLPAPRAYAQLGWLGGVTSPAPYERLGRILFLLHQPALARPWYEDARVAWPQGFTAWALLGHLAATAREYPVALQYYEQAIGAEPASAELRWRAGLAALQAGNGDAAARHADIAVRLAPNDWQKLALKGTAELMRKNPADAITYLQSAIQRAPQPDPTLHRSLAKAQYLQHQVDAAIASFERAWQLDPTDASVAADLGRIHAARGDAAAAQTWAGRALQIDPKNAVARGILGAGH